MKKAVKILSLILALIMCVSCFAACGEEDGDGASTTDAGETAADETTGDVKPSSKGLEFTIAGEGYSVTGIGSCTDTDIVIPSKHDAKPVTSIGYDAFSGCTSITSITIPDTVKIIEAGAFRGCTALNYNEYNNGKYLGNANNPYLVLCDVIDVAASSFEIHGDTKIIGYSAFEACTLLTSVTIPDGVTSIGWDAFSGCTSITSITIPDSVKIIEAGAFSDCTALNYNEYNNGKYLGNTNNPYLVLRKVIDVAASSFEIHGDTKIIGYSAFEACTLLTSVTIPDGVTSIGSSAFDYCPSLENVSIPNSVTSIGSSAFAYCLSLTSVDISYRITSIDDGAFYGCTSLTSVAIPAGVTNIGASAFAYCESLTSVTLPDSVARIGNEAFCDCTSLTSVTLGNGVTSVGDWAFNGCKSLNYNEYKNGNYLGNRSNPYVLLCSMTNTAASSFEIHGDTKIIGYAAFYDCSSLKSIAIPDSVTSIGFFSFRYCASLTSLTIGSGVTSIGVDAFSCCDSLTNMVVDKNNKVYHSAGNCIIETASKTLVAGCKASVIPADGSVVSIGDWAFYDCTSLTSITIPNSVTSIGDYAFSGCESLTSITLPDSITSIGASAFSNYLHKSITYGGTMAQWNAISKAPSWYSGSGWDNIFGEANGSYIAHCIDGDVSE